MGDAGTRGFVRTATPPLQMAVTVTGKPGRSGMETGTGRTHKALGSRAKNGLAAVAVLEIVFGALAAMSGANFNDDCEARSDCVPQADVDQIIAVGLVVALVLFLAAGLAIAALLRPEGRPRWQVPLALVLGGAGGCGWLVLFLMIATAGIRATT